MNVFSVCVCFARGNWRLQKTFSLIDHLSHFLKSAVIIQWNWVVYFRLAMFPLFDRFVSCLDARPTIKLGIEHTSRLFTHVVPVVWWLNTSGIWMEYNNKQFDSQIDEMMCQMVKVTPNESIAWNSESNQIIEQPFSS